MPKSIKIRAAFDNYSGLIRREFIEDDLPTRFKLRDEIEELENKIVELIHAEIH